jgi:hypothetical protein
MLKVKIRVVSGEPESYEHALDRDCRSAGYHKVTVEMGLNGETLICTTYVRYECYPIELPSGKYLKYLVRRYRQFHFYIGPILKACMESDRARLDRLESE